MDGNDRELVKFTSLAHALFHTYELSIPLFVGTWMAEFGASAALIGVVVGAGYGLVGVGAPPSGVLSDRFGSRRLILASVVGMGVGFALVGFARGLASLAAAVLLWGAFASLYHPAGLSLISRAAEARGTVFAYHGAGGNVGTALGPLVTALLLLAVDWRVAAAVLSIPAFVAALVGLRIEFEVPPRDDDVGMLSAEIRRLARDSRGLFGLAFTVAFVAVLLYGTYYRGLLTFLPDVLAESPSLVPIEVAGHEVDPAQYVYTALLTVGIAGQYAGGRLTDHLPSTTAFLGALSVLSGLALLFPAARSAGTVPLVAVCLLLGFFVYGTAPVYQVVIAENAAADVHGLSYGFTYLAMFGVGALGASLAGFVLTHATSRELFVVLAAVAAAGVGFVALLRRL
jgi:MFS family permease